MKNVHGSVTKLLLSANQNSMVFKAEVFWKRFIVVFCRGCFAFCPSPVWYTSQFGTLHDLYLPQQHEREGHNTRQLYSLLPDPSHNESTGPLLCKSDLSMYSRCAGDLVLAPNRTELSWPSNWGCPGGSLGLVCNRALGFSWPLGSQTTSILAASAYGEKGEGFS